MNDTQSLNQGRSISDGARINDRIHSRCTARLSFVKVHYVAQSLQNLKRLCLSLQAIQALQSSPPMRQYYLLANRFSPLD